MKSHSQNTDEHGLMKRRAIYPPVPGRDKPVRYIYLRCFGGHCARTPVFRNGALAEFPYFVELACPCVKDGPHPHHKVKP